MTNFIFLIEIVLKIYDDFSLIVGNRRAVLKGEKGRGNEIVYREIAVS